MTFSIAYPGIFVLFCLLLGAAYAFVLYRKKKTQYENQKLFWLLAGLRTLAVSMLAFLLLSPIFRSLQNKEEKPTIAILKDNSASQKFGFRTTDSIAYRQNLNALIDKLSETYVVKTYSFGDVLNDTLAYDYKEQATDISSNLEGVVQSFDNENLAAIVLASDGIYNRGANPAYQQTAYNGTIYTIGVGDTTIQKDAAVSRVFANKVVYLNDQFAIRSDVTVYAGKGQNLNLSIYSHSAARVIASKTMNVNSHRYASSIETIVDANRPGLHRYTISISTLEGEKNVANNSQDVYVEVLDSKEKILILANAPHPDINALKEALSLHKNYKLSVCTIDQLTLNPREFNLIILHNLPSVRYNASSIIAQAKEAGISLWFIAGTQCALPLLNQSQNALTITARGSSGTDAFASLNPSFSYFKLNLPPIINFPPLAAPMAAYAAGPNTQALFHQRIGSVRTDYPLWILQTGARAKTAVLAGEGLWRWRFYDYQQHKNYKLTDELITQTAQFLSVKNDKRKFRVTTQQSVFNQSDAITFDAELYNENYELVNNVDVNLEIKDSSGKVYKYTMNKEGTSYSLNIGTLGSGSYSYHAHTTMNGSTQSAAGNFRVIAQNMEDVNTTADFGMLSELAKNHNGEFVYASQLNSLYDKIKANKNIKTVLRTELTTFPLIDKKWLFFFIFCLLAAEWFIRKRFGGY